MQIKILGSLKVSCNGVSTTPTAPKLRQVLALLAVYANKVVRTEQIIEELWEEDPPPSVMTTLQTYIYQLRKLLSAHNLDNTDIGSKRVEPVLHTSLHGYLLSVSPEMLDYRRFEKLAEQGRTEFETGRVADAARTLSEAIALWRGPALIDVTAGPALRPEILRLTELRTSALQCRIDADLQLGRHHELLGELTGLAAQHPTHEGFQARLMLALHRAGRRAEALSVYQRTRGELADELGLDPSTELQQLHRAVLASHRSLDLPRAEPGAPAEAHAPCHLPPKGPALAGRDQELADALTALSSPEDRTALVVVSGPPGSGKTALCVHAAYRARHEYPDGQLYCSALDEQGRRVVDPGEILATLLRGLGVRRSQVPASTEDRCLMFRTWTAYRRLLLVLDDVVDADQLHSLLPCGDGCGVLVASRRRLSAPGATAYVQLGPLDPATSLHMLSTAVGDNRVGETEGHGQELVRMCNGLPTALHAAAAKLRLRPHWKLERLISWLDRATAGEGLAADPLRLRSSLERSYWSLAPHVRTACSTLARTGLALLTPSTAAEALGVDQHSAEALLEDLVEAQLMSSTHISDAADGSLYQWLPSLRISGRYFVVLDAEPAVPAQRVMRPAGMVAPHG